MTSQSVDKNDTVEKESVDAVYLEYGYALSEYIPFPTVEDGESLGLDGCSRRTRTSAPRS